MLLKKKKYAAMKATLDVFTLWINWISEEVLMQNVEFVDSSGGRWSIGKSKPSKQNSKAGAAGVL